MSAAFALADLCITYLRPISSFDTSTSPPTPVFDPPLTAAEQVTFDRIVKLAASLVQGITPTEWQAIQSDIDGLVTYQGLASPTLAQTVLAVKAQSRILRAILKN